ncbi:hypothetical protein PYCC9005_005548 [Savitreella phatthalungensis]
MSSESDKHKIDGGPAENEEEIKTLPWRKEQRVPTGPRLSPPRSRNSSSAKSAGNFSSKRSSTSYDSFNRSRRLSDIPHGYNFPPSPLASYDERRQHPLTPSPSIHGGNMLDEVSGMLRRSHLMHVPFVVSSPTSPASPTGLVPLTSVMTPGEIPSLVGSSTPGDTTPLCLSPTSPVSPEQAKQVIQNSPLSAIAMAEVAHQAALQRRQRSNSTKSGRLHKREDSNSSQLSQGPLPVELEEALFAEPKIPQPIPSLFSTPANDAPQQSTLHNPSRTKNIYVRGLPPETTDDNLYAICRRFGRIVSSKAIIDVSTGHCKGFGFCEFDDEQSARNSILALTHYGYQVSFAKDSFNDRLQDLRDSSSTNLYLSNLPVDMCEEDVEELFSPHRIVSQRILRDANRTSRGVGFARLETRRDCDDVIAELNGTKLPGCDQALQVRYADSPLQKKLKTQTQQRRQWRAREYNSKFRWE